MSTRSSETSKPSWRSAQLSAEELSARREERRALREERGAQRGSREGSRQEVDGQGQAPSAERAKVNLERDPQGEPLSTGSLPWRAREAAEEEGESRSWRSAQLSEGAQQARDEQRALRAGERAERRAAKREKASQEWERSPARRAARRARREGEKEVPDSPVPKAERSSKPPSTAHERAQAGSERDQRGTKKRRARAPVDGEWLREAGLKYLGRFASSEAHFRRVLTRKLRRAEARVSEDPADHARWLDEAVRYAYQCGGLNDELFARSLLNSMRRQGLSSAMIRQKLRQKGLDLSQVKRAFEEREEERDPELDQLASAARAARKKRLGPWGPSGLDYPARQKQLAALARRGFSFGVAKRVLEASLERAEEWANSLN